MNILSGISRSGIFVTVFAMTISSGYAQRVDQESATTNIDQLLAQQLKTFDKWKKVADEQESFSRSVRGAYADLLLNEVETSQLSHKQWAIAWGISQGEGDSGDALMHRAKVLIKENSLEGAQTAAKVAATGSIINSDNAVGPISEAIGHPNFAEALRVGDPAPKIVDGKLVLDPAWKLAFLMQSIDADQMEAISPLLMDLTFSIMDNATAEDIGWVHPFALHLEALDKNLDQKKRGQLNAASAQFLRSVIEEVRMTNEPIAAQIDSMLPRIEGPFGRGELIGYPAPSLSFDWTSAKFTAEQLTDLKGKIVLVDFWATWCGPCMASFPAMRELQKRYEGYDVVLLGVTSLQGYHTQPGEGITDTEDKPDLERQLMQDYIKEMEMTWPVVFSTQSVFNTDWGVYGIPHRAIVDENGVVRYNKLYDRFRLDDNGNQIPDLREDAKLIDELLKKAGKRVPPPIKS